MKLSDIRVDAAAIEGGVWIPVAGDPDLPGLPGVRLKVRGLSSLAVQRGRIAREAALGLPAGERPDAETADRLWNAALAADVIVDWSGIENDAGADLPFSRAKAQELLIDPNYRDLRAAVTLAALQADKTRPPLPGLTAEATALFENAEAQAVKN